MHSVPILERYGLSTRAVCAAECFSYVGMIRSGDDARCDVCRNARRDARL